MRIEIPAIIEADVDEDGTIRRLYTSRASLRKLDLSEVDAYADGSIREIPLDYEEAKALRDGIAASSASIEIAESRRRLFG